MASEAYKANSSNSSNPVNAIGMSNRTLAFARPGSPETGYQNRALAMQRSILNNGNQSFDQMQHNLRRVNRAVGRMMQREYQSRYGR